jgi:hypothetical protein
MFGGQSFFGISGLSYKTKDALAPVLNRILAGYGRLISRRHMVEDAVVISGVPRGGTTWLYEILLKSIPNSCGIWEPLFLPGNNRLNALGFSWRQHIAPQDEWAEAEELFRDILRGAYLNLSFIHGYSLGEFFGKSLGAERFVIKFCRANRLLMWMTKKVGARSPILLIRHPCAVVASQLHHGGWNHVVRETASEHPMATPEYEQEWPWIGEIVRKTTTPEERLAVTWCLDYFVPLSEKPPHPWILVSYERLVTDGRKELERVFKAIGGEVPGSVGSHLKAPSMTTRRGSNVLTGEDPLATWRTRLTRNQQKRILSAVARFGMDFYSEALEPDYGRLYENPLGN